MTSERETRALIDRLAVEAGPVRPGPAPHRALAGWLIVSLPFCAAIVLLMSPRPDLAVKLAELRFVIEQGLALATAVTAAFAAFAAVLPGRGGRALWLPAIPGGLWVASLGAGCVIDALRAGASAWQLTGEAECLLYIALLGSVPALVLLAGLRRGAPVAPRLTLFLAVLASAALGNFALRFFHMQDAGIMVLVWQFGSVVLLAALAGMCGPRLLPWRHRAG